MNKKIVLKATKCQELLRWPPLQSHLQRQMAENEAQDPLRLSCNCRHASRFNLSTSGCMGKIVEQLPKYNKARENSGEDPCLDAARRVAEVFPKAQAN